MALTSADGTVDGASVAWDLGSIGPVGGTAPPAGGSRSFTARLTETGEHAFTGELTYRVGASTFTVGASVTVRVVPDRDGDGVPDEDDPFPDDPARCGDGNGDGCDDCDAACRADAGAGLDGGPGGGETGGCGCRAAPAPGTAGLLFASLALALLGRRRSR